MRVSKPVIALLFLAAMVFAIEVDVVELESTLLDTINFVNYVGVQTGNIDTIEAIRGIGEGLSTEIGYGESLVYARKYRVTHLPPAEDGLRGADLFELLPASRVDHIDNLRRIISAYLENRYGYSMEDARLLGELITIYNAVHRGNRDLFLIRYTAGLNSLLEEGKIGLSLTYSDWPGQSQIVIPIAPDAALGELSSVPVDELLDETVEETLRDAADLGLEERMAAADLIDRTVDEEISQISAEQDAIARQQQELRTEEETIQTSITELEEELEETEPASPERRQTEEQIAQQESQLQEVQQGLEDLSIQQDATEQRQIALDRADERSSEIRESVVEDIEASSAPSPSSPLLITRGRVSDGSLFSTIVNVNTNAGTVLLSTEREIVGRNYLLTRNGLVAISEERGRAALVLFDSATLSILTESTIESSPYSPIIAGPGGDLYAVVKDGSEWYVGHFDGLLNLLFRSSIPVAEESDLVIEGRRLFVQRKDGRFTGLDLNELRVLP